MGCLRLWVGAEGGTAQQAIGVATARALAEGGPPAQAVARAFAIAIAIYGCPGVKPIISSEAPLSLHAFQLSAMLPLQ